MSSKEDANVLPLLLLLVFSLDPLMIIISLGLAGYIGRMYYFASFDWISCEKRGLIFEWRGF